jgi:tetratricopeptide (TPR) repeat protein
MRENAGVPNSAIGSRLVETGKLAQGRGEWRQALADYSEAVALRPDNPLAWSARGTLYRLMSLWEQAAADHARSFAWHRSSEASIWYDYASLRLFVGDTEGYDRTCAEMLEHLGAGLDAQSGWYVASAATLGPNGVDPEQLVRLAEAARDVDRHRPSYLLTLGAAYYRAGRFAEAVRCLEEAAGQDPGWIYAEVWPLLALAHHRLGHAREARDWLKRAERGREELTRLLVGRPLDPHVPPVTFREVREAYLLEREARTALGEDPAVVEPLRWAFRFCGHALLGKWDEADAAFERVLAAHPREASFWYAHGDYEGRLGRWERAAADLAHGIALEPAPGPWEWYVHAELCLRTGDGAGYRRACAELLDRFGRTGEPWRAQQLALVCSLAPDAADRRAVTRLAEAAVAREPHNPWFLLTLGAARYRAGDFAHAGRLLRQAVQERWPDEVYRESGQALAWYFLGMTARRLGRGDEARRWLDLADGSTARATAGEWKDDLGTAWHVWAICQILYREAEAQVAAGR